MEAELLPCLHRQVVHLKDFHVEGKQEGDPYALIGLNEGEKKAKSAFEFRPLGKGVQDIPSIIAASVKAGSKWLIVEQDQPSMEKTPMECVAMSMEYLKSIAKDCHDENGKCTKPESEQCAKCKAQNKK